MFETGTAVCDYPVESAQQCAGEPLSSGRNMIESEN
jgi:hypothetical protein